MNSTFKNKDIKERLIAVFNSLNNIELKGFANASNMAGSMQIISEIIEKIVVESDIENGE